MKDLHSVRHRFEVLDIFRGIFATLVFLFHLGPFTETPLINNSFVENSDMFVDFFFVLSGFVIAYSYQTIADYGLLKQFFTKRFYRIYPLHFFMLIIFVGMEIAKNALSPYVKVNNLVNPDNNIITFLTSLFLLNSTPIPSVRAVSWNIPSWSISAEMIAYLVFGSLVLFINLSRSGSVRNLYYLLTIGISIIGLWMVSHTFRLNYSFDFGFLRGILGFFIGVLCFNFFIISNEKVKGWPNYIFSIAELLTISLIIICISHGEALKSWGIIFEILFFLCIYIFSYEKGLLSSALKTIPFLQKLGKYSYSIYMTHALFISLFNVLFIRILKFPPSSYSYLVILNFVLIYFASAWTYKHIEMKFNFKKKQSEKSPIHI